MTAALDLLARARRQGIVLGVDGDRLTYEGPAGAVEALLPHLRRHKADLLVLLRAEAELVEALGLLRAAEIVEAAHIGSARVDRTREPPVAVFRTTYGVTVWSALPAAVALAEAHERQHREVAA